MKNFVISILILAICLNSCTKDNEVETPAPGNTSNLFPGSRSIGVPPYSYDIFKDSIATTIVVRGDSSFKMRYADNGFPLPKEDNLTSRPVFEWIPTGSRFVMAAIFDTIPNVSQIDKFNINNPDKIIWAWHTGLGTGREGSIGYDGGRQVVNGKIIENGQLPSLAKRGRPYYWAVWAWDERANKITYSSLLIPFRVTVAI